MSTPENPTPTPPPNEELLQLATSPKGKPGTRWINNVPLYLGCAVCCIFLLIFFMELSNRTNAPTQQEEKVEKPSANAVKLASEVTAEWLNGIIPRAQPNNEKSVQTETSPATTSTASTEEQATNEKEEFPSLAQMSRHEKDYWEAQRQAITEARIQAYQAALQSPTVITTVQAPEAKTVVHEQIAAAQQQLEAMRNPMEAYQARLAQVRAQLSGNSGVIPASSDASENTSSSIGNLQQFSRDSWTLPHAVATHARYTLQAGFVLPAIMISGITSNLPGQVIAQVSHDVFDSPTGRYLLIPQGTRLIGTYNADINFGQNRILMAWQRLLFPDGTTLDIEAMPGTDASGNAGFKDEVNNHYFRLFASSILLSGVIAGVNLSQESNDSGDSQRASDALSEALGQTLGQTMSDLIRKNMNVSPTLHIRPGYRFNIMATKDIVFATPYGRNSHD